MNEFLFYLIEVTYLGIALGAAYEVLIKQSNDDDDSDGGMLQPIPVYVVKR